jgi:hypothetical protein
MSDERDSTSKESQRKFPPAPSERPCLSSHTTAAPDRLICHPSGMKNDLSFASRSGGVAIAQPPANFCYPSGIKTNSTGRELAGWVASARCVCISQKILRGAHPPAARERPRLQAACRTVGEARRVGRIRKVRLHQSENSPRCAPTCGERVTPPSSGMPHRGRGRETCAQRRFF